MIAGRSRGCDDETLALSLLEDFLKAHSYSEFVCELSECDPPDLIVKFSKDARWGVEVTRTYQQIVGVSEQERLGSSEFLTARLEEFGKRLADLTVRERKLDYSIFLGRRTFVTIGDEVQSFDKKWEKGTLPKVKRHIASGSTGRLDLPGVALVPGKPGNRWSVVTSVGPAAMSTATSGMLKRALTSKANRLEAWGEDFTERWLLLLNCNPLVDDSDEVKRQIIHITKNNRRIDRFNGIFWSGFPERKLIQIFL